ncbi:serine threonine [Cordyceps militaris]|uniref:non-specific serine/threonine protein kinase n=1 Tax=Cordyceps militaris TaxID=73501 RepID=A0A2H4SV67_CORMI|nr:serine threonine [Cordyceps militaris]
MEHNIVAYLYPCSQNFQMVVAAMQANPRYVPPLLQFSENCHERDRHERASTEPPENPGASALDYLPSLVVRLSDVPRTDKGLIFGSNRKCDVHLSAPGISNIHFSLSFDDLNRPIIQDLNSLVGTQVTYDGDGKGVRRDFCWIVGGDDIPRKASSIIITIPDTVSLQIIVQPQNIESPAYVNGVGRFKQGAATTEALLNELGLSNPPTRGTQTPASGEIHLKKKIGHGTLGVVRRFWNVSTGEERAVKTPRRSAIENGQIDHAAWAREARIMSLISHPHIVKLIESFFYPQPELHLEYMPYGSLQHWIKHRKGISYPETVTITHQCLSALAYLHGQATPIAHRDIKPTNILIQTRSRDGIIFVKLSDFGTARSDLDLSTYCGTHLYLAPEVHLDEQRRVRHERTLGHATTVDIWSLGVVAYQLLYSLRGCTGLGVALCESIERELRENVRRIPVALGSILVRCMVVMSPAARWSASQCCNMLEEMLRTERGFFQGLTSASSSAGEDQAALTPKPPSSASSIKQYDESPTPSSSASTIQQYDESPAPSSSASTIQQYDESPSPSSSASTIQQYDESPAPSSSEIRRYNKLQHEGHELDAVFKDHSASGLNRYHYGSSIAAEFGGNDSEDWASVFCQESLQSQTEVQGSSQSQIEVAGSQARTRTSIPRGESEGWRLQGGNAIDADDDEEKKHAALLREAIGGSYRLREMNS